MKLNEVIDIELLKKQKLALLRAITDAPAANVQLLEGILNLMDALHDEIDPPVITPEVGTVLPTYIKPEPPIDEDEDGSTTITVNDAELAIILASLRLWQDTPYHNRQKQDDIATDGGSHSPLSNEDIDDLCERINV